MENIGAFAFQEIADFLDTGVISAPDIEAAKKNVQPSSIDLSLAGKIWGIKGSFLPKSDESVEKLIERYAKYELDIASGHGVLERDTVYIAELRESLNLGLVVPGVYGYTNNKSSTGRIGLHTRLITDRNPRYDDAAKNYKGKTYVQIIPKTFVVRVNPGDTLNQIRLFNGDSRLDDVSLRMEHSKQPLMYKKDESSISPDDMKFDGGILMTVDLENEIAAWRAKKTGDIINLGRKRVYDVDEFWEPIRAPKDGALVLSEGEFYLLSTREYISVPTHLASEMVPYDPKSGDFRSHYAGFFDPGFGFGKRGEIRGTPATLEVMVHGSDMVIRHGQPVCKMVFERMRQIPSVSYGDTGSHYQRQRGPTLSKHFKIPEAVPESKRLAA